jgi:hypothetical protein
MNLMNGFESHPSAFQVVIAATCFAGVAVSATCFSYVSGGTDAETSEATAHGDSNTQ